jgi:hypothetical protein
MADTQKASELEERITLLILDNKWNFDRKERDMALKRINELARQYHELTGRHYDISKTMPDYDRKY